MANEQPTTALAPAAIEGALSVKSVMDQVNLIQRVMKEAMKEGEHYGTIPGCGDKKVLKKGGAEKLNLTFRLAPEFEIDVVEMGNMHREYRIKCTIRSIVSGVVLGSGVGSCTTMEKKYRYITGPKESTGQPVPKDYWNFRNSDPQRAQESIGGKGFATAKVNGVWEIVVQGEKVENDNPADFYNTCLKMAKKRAMVDAVLTVTAASDIFTQDLDEEIPEDIPEENLQPRQPVGGKPPVQQPKAKKYDNGTPTASKAQQPRNLKPDTVKQLREMMSDMGWSEQIQNGRLKWADGAGDEKALDFVTAEYNKFLDQQAAEESGQTVAEPQL